MPGETNPMDPRSLWQDQKVEKVVLSLEEIRLRAARFERRIHSRNVREYVAGVVVIGLFTLQLSRAHGWRLTPPALVIAGTLYVLFQLHRRASARPLPADLGRQASIAFHRAELERQRDAIRGVWHWYLLPFVPGLAAGLAVTAIDHGINATWNKTAAVFVLVFMGIWALNRRGARTLTRKIEELKAMETEQE